MKHNMNRVLSVIALLLLTVGSWAGEVTTVVTPEGAGTVSVSKSSGQNYIITVRPADGYYLTLENLSAVTTLDGGAVQAPTRRTEIEFSSQPVAITGINTADPSSVTTYSFTMPEDENLGVEVTANFQSCKSIANATISDIADQIYTGKAIKPELTVTLDNKQLVQGTDYQVVYSDSIEAGTATATIIGIQTYTGSASKTYTIKKAAAELSFTLESVQVKVDEKVTGQTLTTTPQNLPVAYTSSNTSVATVNASTGEVTLVAIGETTITATVDDNNYSGTAEYLLTVIPIEQYDFTVCGTPVTERNATDILKDGKVRYDKDINMLTLNDATLSPSADGWGVEMGSALSVLNVKLLGANVINGNGFKFTNSKPALVFTTDNINTGSLKIVGENSSLISPTVSEDGASIFYENGLSEYNTVDKMISGQSISLTVGGVEVTSQNMDDILSDGKVSFDATSKTLILNGATIDMSASTGYPIVSSIAELEVRLVGVNTIKTNATNPYAFKFTGLTSGSLTFTHQVNGYGNVSVTGGTLAESYNIVNSEGNGWTMTDNTIGYVENYLSIGNVQISSANLSLTSGDGKASYSPVSKTLSLNNFTTTDAITTTMENLTISLTGVNSVGAVSGAGGEVIISRDIASTAEFNKLLATSITGFETVTVEDPLNVTSPSATPDWSTATNIVISDVVSYSLWVNSTQLTKENMNNIVNGVSFDGDHTLTLNNVNATCGNAPFITSGLKWLTIHLLGTNTINSNSQLFLDKREGDNDHDVTFTTDPNNAGKLTITTGNNSWYDGQNIDFVNNLQVTTNTGNVTIEAPSTYYNLTIGDIQVTNLNATDVLKNGSVTFDATANTLTLSNAEITGNITSGVDILLVNLNGTNTLKGKFVKSGNGSKLIFETQDTKCTLTMDAAIDGLTTEYRSKLRLKDNVIAIPESYGITIADEEVTKDNRLTICNGTVEYDNNAMLILNGATINGEIVVEKVSSIPQDSLTVYLKNTNVINVGTKQKAFKCLEGKLKVAFVTDGTDPGTLEINYQDSVYNKNVEVTYKDLVASTAETESGKKLTIKRALDNVVDDENKKADVDFSNLPPSTNTNNQTINNILMTMGDESGNKEGSSGFDQSQNAMVFVGAAAMTEKGLEEVLEEQPGTQAYADKFTGLTFALPAGTSIIEITSYIANPDYAFYVQVGNQKPVEIESGTVNGGAISMAIAQLKIAVAQAGVVKLFMMEKLKDQNQNSEAPQMANRRIGPKSSVAGGLGGITIQSSNMQVSANVASTHKRMERTALINSLSAIINAADGFVCRDENVTSLPDNMFISNETHKAPRRAGTISGTVLPEELTFVDFSNTKITGIEISRTSGAFNGVPENVFIYVPAGNTTKEKNVVIGGICDKVELDGEITAKPFKAMKNFTAGQAVLKRSFTAGSETSKATIYLPFAISQEDADKLGIFYEYEGNDGKTVDMKSVKKGGLKANKPYIFQAKEGGVENPLLRVVSISADPVETKDFKGVYERKEYEEGMYCFVGQDDGKHTIGQFVEMGPKSYVPPFRAYMIGKNTSAYAIAWDGVIDNMENEQEPTAIETIETTKTVADKKVAEGWWTLNGIRMTEQPKKAGLYICNGKMVVVK